MFQKGRYKSKACGHATLADVVMVLPKGRQTTQVILTVIPGNEGAGAGQGWCPGRALGVESREPDLILGTRAQRCLRGHLRLGRRQEKHLRRVQWDARSQRRQQRGPVEERREGGVRENPAEAWQQGQGFRCPLNV